ncbi:MULTISPECIES: AAA family ATPase [Sporomusa]|uniref:ATP-binding protein n=1 Tax=Sporomusa TaxID=2375 RepID=UPI002D0B58E8|nr:AAA family ATPase [Sporomusa sphaeroides]HML32868.1 AAA family ATPase [Sporomusa sphaeroides]
MTKKIAVAGKGGVGKTTFTALLIRELMRQEKGIILAVDADPNSNLNEALGIDVDDSISNILEEVRLGDDVPTGMGKDSFTEYRLSQIIKEGKGMDLIQMGLPQQNGCYCYPNNLMRMYLEQLQRNYEYVIIDNEAGMEHLSRRIVADIDMLFIISDTSVRSIRSAAKVVELIKVLKISIPEVYLIITKTGEAGIDGLKEEIAKTGLDLVGTIPYDVQAVTFDFEGKPLIDLPDDSLSVMAVKTIMEKAGV